MMVHKRFNIEPSSSVAWHGSVHLVKGIHNLKVIHLIKCYDALGGPGEKVYMIHKTIGVFMRDETRGRSVFFYYFIVLWSDIMLFIRLPEEMKL